MKETTRQYWLVFVSGLTGYFMGAIYDLLLQNFTPVSRLFGYLTGFVIVTTMVAYLILSKASRKH